MFFRIGVQYTHETPVLESPFKGIVNLFSVTVKKYILLQYLRKRRSLSA